MRARRLILGLAIVVVGCHGGRTAPTVLEVRPPAPGALPALYAGLFVEGRVFRYEVTTVHEEPNEDGTPRDDDEPSAPDEAICTVTSVERRGRGAISTIDCEGGRVDGVAGTWAADDRGIWTSADDDVDLATVDLADAVLTAAPVARHDETVEPDDPSTARFANVEAKGDGWCFTSGTTYGDESWSELCFAGGVISGGSTGTCGYACDEVHFKLVDAP